MPHVEFTYRSSLYDGSDGLCRWCEENVLDVSEGGSNTYHFQCEGRWSEEANERHMEEHPEMVVVDLHITPTFTEWLYEHEIDKKIEALIQRNKYRLDDPHRIFWQIRIDESQKILDSIKNTFEHKKKFVHLNPIYF